MLKFHQIYLINEIPDIDYLGYQKNCQTSVPETISMLFRHFLKRLSILKAGDVEVTLRMSFRSASKHGSLQSRMSIFFIIKACDRMILDDLKTTIEKGVLNKFYNFISVDNMDIPVDKLNEISVITREENLIKPSVSNDLNYQVPSCYYSIEPFEPNESNFFMELDKTCDKIENEIVIIDVAVKPMEIKPLCVSHSKYLSILDGINNTWGINNDELSQVDYFDNTQSLYSQKTDNVLNPLAVKDPVADIIFSMQRRFHETLYNAHLAFNIRILSETPQVNSLITSCVANSAFQNGHYQSFSPVKGTKEFESVSSSAKHLYFYDIIFSKITSQTVEESIYYNLGLLNQCATIEELSGIFKFPVAVCLNSPCCIRKNTDPLPVSNKTKTILLGTDAEIKDFPIELPLSFICKHIFISGMPGSGKTTAVQHLMLNLWEQSI